MSDLLRANATPIAAHAELEPRGGSLEYFAVDDQDTLVEADSDIAALNLDGLER